MSDEKKIPAYPFGTINLNSPAGMDLIMGIVEKKRSLQEKIWKYIKEKYGAPDFTPQTESENGIYNMLKEAGEI